MILLQTNELAPPLHLPGYGYRSEEINSKCDPISHLSTVTSFRPDMMFEVSDGSLE